MRERNELADSCASRALHPATAWLESHLDGVGLKEPLCLKAMSDGGRRRNRSACGYCILAMTDRGAWHCVLKGGCFLGDVSVPSAELTGTIYALEWVKRLLYSDRFLWPDIINIYST